MEELWPEELPEDGELARLRDEAGIELAIAAGARGGRGWTLMDGNEPVAFLTRPNTRGPVELETRDQILRFELVGVFRRRIRILDQTGQPWATITEPEFGATAMQLPGDLPYSLRGGVSGYIVRDTSGRDILHAYQGGARILVVPGEAPSVLVLAAILSYLASAEVDPPSTSAY